MKTSTPFLRIIILSNNTLPRLETSLRRRNYHGISSLRKFIEKNPGLKKTYLQVFKEILTNVGNFKYKVNLGYIDYYSKRDKWITNKFIKIFGPKRKYEEPLTNHHKNIAAALQDQLENVVLKQLNIARKNSNLINYAWLEGWH